MGHHDGGGSEQLGSSTFRTPSAFEVCSVFSVGECNLNTDAESTCEHQRGRIRRHQSAGLVHTVDGLVTPLGSYVGVGGFGVPAAGARNTDSKHTILLLQGEALQSELERPIPLIGLCGQIAPDSIVPPDISGPFVGKLVAVLHQVTRNHSWTVVPRENAPLPTVTPARQLHLYRIPDRDQEDQDLADTTCLQEDQRRAVPKAVNKALKSLSYSWPRRTEVYPTLDTGK